MKLFSAMLFLLAMHLGVHAQQIAPFKPGDQIVFAGNSITEAGLYENYIWLYYLTHFPDIPIRVINGGVGGDVAGQILARLDGDLLPKKPTVLVLTFGMNDSKYFEYGDTTKTQQTIQDAVVTSKNSFDQILTRLQQLPKLRKIMMTSSPYDETMENSKNLFKGKSIAMDRIAAFQQEAAKINHWDFVDMFHPMTTINQREQARKSDFTLTGPDRIHPGSAGHFVMAYLFLKNQGFANKPVADVVLDAKTARTNQTQNASVNNIKKTEQGITFDYLAKSLPYPIDTVPRVWENFQTQKQALQVIPFMQEFNQERLAISGLDDGRYDVLIDGEHLLKTTNKELAAGINLAEYTNTPQYKQALRLMDLNRQHRELEAKLRNYYWVQYDFLKDKGLLFNDSEAARDTALAYTATNIFLKSKMADYEIVRNKTKRKDLEQQMALIRKQLYQLNKPTSHRILVQAY
ncbi:Lysophospholipase L1 [bacterium A37T11]|nr:Lysophospholipase L1 [bacterium A37T11]